MRQQLQLVREHQLVLVLEKGYVHAFSPHGRVYAVCFQERRVGIFHVPQVHVDVVQPRITLVEIQFEFSFGEVADSFVVLFCCLGIFSSHVVAQAYSREISSRYIDVVQLFGNTFSPVKEPVQGCWNRVIDIVDIESDGK